ncbi:hypothetical protein SDC9_204741 [bioreactor metagenome]|uniref:Uncharacterized protein n=1 Tax=bioreactor metagenome TaxID=1076179 RepID=A0A645J0W6_9ZZZZ
MLLRQGKHLRTPVVQQFQMDVRAIPVGDFFPQGFLQLPHGTLGFIIIVGVEQLVHDQLQFYSYV